VPQQFPWVLFGQAGNWVLVNASVVGFGCISLDDDEPGGDQSATLVRVENGRFAVFAESGAVSIRDILGALFYNQ
jgi:hypothetical protein